MAVETEPAHIVFALLLGIPALYLFATQLGEPTSFFVNLYKHLTTPKTTLTFSPSRLTTFDITAILVLIIVKYIKSFLGLLPKLDQAPSSSTTASGGRDVKIALPLIEMGGPLDSGRYDGDRFARAVFPILRQHRPVVDENNLTDSTSPLLLAALTTPLMLLMLSHHKSPILPLGAVHVANRYEFIDPYACRNVDFLENKLFCNARMGGEGKVGEGRRTRRGLEFDIIVEVVAQVKSGSVETRPIFRQFVTILQFLKKSAKPVYVESSTTKQSSGGVSKYTARPFLPAIKLPKQAPSRWATVCKDYNPIHMSYPAALLFGFKGRVVHGNHMVALAMQQAREPFAGMEDERSKQEEGMSVSVRQCLWEEKKGSWLEIEFKRPIIISSTVQVRYGPLEQGKGKVGFEIVGKDDEIKVIGRVGLL